MILLEKIFTSVFNFFIVNQLVALIIFVFLALFLWKKPWDFLKCTLGLLALLAGIYVFSFLNDSAFVGEEKKQDITSEREETLFKE